MSEAEANAKVLADALRDASKEHARAQLEYPPDRPKRADEVWMSAWMTCVRANIHPRDATPAADAALAAYRTRFETR